MVHFTTRDRALLSQRINDLGETEHGEILKILHRHDINQTSNRNGIFVNLSTIDDVVIEEISNFVNYCISNKAELDAYDKRINECKIRQEYNDIMNKHHHHPPCTHTHQSQPHLEMHTQEQSIIQIEEDGKGDGATSTWSEIDKKNDSLKYIQAKKKYSKRRVEIVRDGDGEDLKPEPYLITENTSAVC